MSVAAFQVFDIFLAQLDSAEGQLWLDRSVVDLSAALLALDDFMAEVLPTLVETSFDSLLQPVLGAEAWIVEFAARMRQRFQNGPIFHKWSCLSYLEEDCSWTVTRIWLEWRHFLTPPAWVCACKASHASWMRALGKRLALSEEEKDILRFCAQTLSASRRSPEHARCICEVFEQVPIDGARSERVWWTVGCPPSCSPWWGGAPLADL